jgi:hypothetical protein
MNQIIKYVTVICLLVLTYSAQAQQDSLYVRRKTEVPAQKAPWTEKVSLGGNFGLAFGNPTFINISPLIGYRFTDKLVAGGGPSYIYTRVKIYGRNFENSIAGGRLFGQHLIFENFAARAELEHLGIQYPVWNGTDYDKRREWVTNPMIGASYNMPIGRKASFNITALYNLNYQNNLNQQFLYGRSPFIIRAGFML